MTTNQMATTMSEKKLPSNLDYEDYFLSQRIRARVFNAHNNVNSWEKKIFNSINNNSYYDIKRELISARKEFELALEELKLLEDKHLLQDV